MIVIVRAQVTFELNRQLILLVAETTVEYFLYFLDLSLDFLLTLCYNLDCHHLHEAGSRSHQEIKSARKAQDPWKLMLPCDLPFPWKDRHKCYMLPTIRCRFEQESSINLRASYNENYADKYRRHTSRFLASSSVSSTSISSFLLCTFSSAVKKSSCSCFPTPNFGSLIPAFIGSTMPTYSKNECELAIYSIEHIALQLVQLKHVGGALS